MNSNYRNSLAWILKSKNKKDRKLLLDLAKKRDKYQTEKETHVSEIQSFLELTKIEELENILNVWEFSESENKPIEISEKTTQIYSKKIWKYKALLEQVWIIELLESKWISFDELISQSKESLQEKYGSAYFKVRELLFDILKNRLSKEELEKKIEWVKNRINMVMDVFFDNDLESNIWNHLRVRQKESVMKVLNFISESPNDTGYIHYPTSWWKTVMFWDIIRNILKYSPDKKILITVPNKEALYRSAEEFKKIWLEAWLFYWDEKDLSKNITIWTTHSLRIALHNWKIKHNSFDLMICDEAHESYLWEITTDFINSFICKKIWFTATPELKNKRVDQLFTHKIDEYLVDEAILNKELPQIDSHIKLKIDNIEFQKLRVSNWDFTKESLEKFDVEVTFATIKEALKNWVLQGKQIAIFMPSVSSSKKFNDYLNTNWISCEHIDGETKNRKDIKESFESKKVQVLVSCDVLKSSWDSDIIEGVIICRPILSPAVYMQMIGRALHGKNILSSGKKVAKSEVLVVDINNSNQDIIARNITIDSLRSLFYLWWDGTRNGKIKISWSDNISEILFYYDIKEYFTDEKIEQLYKEFAELYDIPLKDFVVKCNSDFSKLYNENITLSIILKSNNKFWENYTGKEREFEIDLWIFKKLISIYKADIEKNKKNIDAKPIFDLEEYLKWMKWNIEWLRSLHIRKPLKILWDYIQEIWEEIIFLDTTYIQVRWNWKVFLLDKTNWEPLILDRKYIQEIWEEVILLDKTYIQVKGYKDNYLLDKTTLKALVVARKYIREILEEVILWGKSYIQVRWTTRIFLLDTTNWQPVIINWEEITKIWEEVILWDKSYIKVSWTWREFILDKTTWDPLIINWNYIDKIWEELILSDKTYIKVSWNWNVCLLSKTSWNHLIIDWKEITRMSEEMILWWEIYHFLWSRSSFFLVHKRTWEPLKIHWNFVSEIWKEISLWNNQYIQLKTNKWFYLFDKNTLQPLKISTKNADIFLQNL